MRHEHVRLLVADDSPSDIYLFKQALAHHSMAHELYTVPDGEAAIDFLMRKGRYSEAPAIDLVVLDINMPKLTGHEVLKQIKADPELKTIPRDVNVFIALSGCRSRL